jgi:hypothetical protein
MLKRPPAAWKVFDLQKCFRSKVESSRGMERGKAGLTS